MDKKRWSDLPQAAKRAIVIVGAVDAGLRAWALADLRRRPAAGVRGSKRMWGLALATVNSAGLLPAAYLVKGRSPADAS